LAERRETIGMIMNAAAIEKHLGIDKKIAA
jgi:hypothetical protein